MRMRSGLLLSLALCTAVLAAVKNAASRPAWSASEFAYQRPESMEVKPSAERIRRHVHRSKQRIVTFTDVRGEQVPVLITVPVWSQESYPVVILLHGLASNKEQITKMAGDALVNRGLACVALDFPKHGSRPGHPRDLFVADDPQATFDNIVQAVVDVRQCIDWAATQNDLDTRNGVGILGYSMGSWFSTLVTAADERVKGVVLMVGGTGAVDFPQRCSTVPASQPTPSQPAVMPPPSPNALASQPANPATTQPAESVAPSVLELFSSVRPRRAIAHISPRPILMQNGRADRFVPAEQTQALFEAAGEPKEIRWYNAGHLLPTRAFDEAAHWLLRLLKNAPS